MDDSGKTKDQKQSWEKKRFNQDGGEIGKLGSLFYVNRGRNPAQVISLDLF